MESLSIIITGLIVLLAIMVIMMIKQIQQRKKAKEEKFEVPDTLPPLNQIVTDVELVDVKTYVAMRKDQVTKEIKEIEEKVAYQKKEYAFLKAELDKLCLLGDSDG